MELFKEAFRGKQAQLVHEIDIEHGLYTELESREVLTKRQIFDIKSCVCITATI